MRRTSLILILGVLAVATGARAQEATETPESVLFADPPISAATKHKQAASVAPSSVTVITRADFQRYGYRTLAEALRSVRGVYVTNDRTYSFLGARGFSQPDDYNNRIVLLVNGHVYNDDIYQAPYVGAEFAIDPEAIERVEIIRGPSAALYGGSAMLAVVNVVTRDAVSALGTELRLDAGSLGRWRGQATYGHLFGDGTELFMSGSALRIDGHDHIFYREYAAPSTKNGFAEGVDGEDAYNVFLSLRHGGFFFQGGANRRAKDVPTGAYSSRFGDGSNRSLDSRRFAELSYNGTPRDDLEIDGRLYYDSYYYAQTYALGVKRHIGTNRDLVESHWLGGELRGRWTLWDTNAVTAGVEFSYHPNAVQQNFDPPTGKVYLDDRRSFDTWAVYLQDEWQVIPNLHLSVGARFDRIYGRFNEVSPRVGLVWHPRAATSVKLLFGRAFRTPSLYDMYYSYGETSLPNPRLRAEHMLSYELVWEEQVARFLSGTMSLYRYTIDDVTKSVTVGQTAGGSDVAQTRNVRSLEALGAEVELRCALPYGVEWRGSYALQTLTDRGHTLSNSPKHLGATQLFVPLPHGATFGAELQIMGPRRTDGGRSLETARLLNLTLRSPVLFGVRLSASAYNLFDHEYPDPVGSGLRQDRIPQDGRTWRLEVEYTF